MRKIFATSTDENDEPNIGNGVQVLERYIDQGDVSPPEQDKVLTENMEGSLTEIVRQTEQNAATLAVILEPL